MNSWFYFSNRFIFIPTGWGNISYSPILFARVAWNRKLCELRGNWIPLQACSELLPYGGTIGIVSPCSRARAGAPDRLLVPLGSDHCLQHCKRSIVIAVVGRLAVERFFSRVLPWSRGPDLFSRISNRNFPPIIIF